MTIPRDISPCGPAHGGGALDPIVARASPLVTGPALAWVDRAVAGRRAAALAAAFVSACYFGAALYSARTRHLWMDEILAVWAARLPSARDVVDAVWNGSEFSPPTYDLLLHWLFTAFGSDPLAARLPSILAIYVAAVAMGAVVARRLGPRVGVASGAFVLASRLFDYAVQARPYALLVALFSIALFLWDRMPATRRDPWRAALIGLLLLGCVSLHFYGILGFAVIGALEAWWSLANRAIRRWAWFSLLAAGLASLAWIPLIRHLAAFNAGDTSAPAYYAKPDLAHLLANGEMLVLSQPAWPYLALVIGLIILGAMAAARRAPRVATPDAAALRDREGPLIIMGAALLAVLPVAFLLGVFVTHAFNSRYAVLANLGLALLVAVALAKAPFIRLVHALFVPILCVAMPWRATAEDDPGRALDLLSHTAVPGPIVVGEALLFIELMESADTATRARLVYLKTPPEVASDDPTNEHQLLRLRGIRPGMPILEAMPFVAAHRTFATIYRQFNHSADPIASWFQKNHWIGDVVDARPGTFLLTIKANPPHDPAS